MFLDRRVDLAAGEFLQVAHDVGHGITFLGSGQ